MPSIGDNTTVRQAFHRAHVPYAFGISLTLTVFRGTPQLRIDPHAPRPWNRPQRAGPIRTARSARAQRRAGADGVGRVSWRNGTNEPWEANFAAVRVTPAHDWRRRRLAPEVWLLCERGLGHGTAQALLRLCRDRSLCAVVRLAHQRWAIEKHYQDLKSELGLDHFEGRTYRVGTTTS